MTSKVQKKSPESSLVQQCLSRALFFSVSVIFLSLMACSSPKKTAPVKDYSSGKKVESTSSAKTSPIQSSKVKAKSDPIKEAPKVAKEAVKDTSKEGAKEAVKDPKKEVSKEVAKTDSKSSESKPLEAKGAKDTKDIKDIKDAKDAKDTKEINPNLDSDLKLVKPALGQTIKGFDGNTNKGIDISGKAGDPIFAAADGRVVYAGDGMRGYGNMVIVKHENAYVTVYAHNKNLLVKEGSAVKRGQKIAEMGNTESDRVKLHFELRRNSKPIDPTNFLQ